MKSNKTLKILEHLKKYKTITSWEAIERYGATRLSAIIFNLRKDYRIESVPLEFTDRYGETSRYTKYVYKGELTKEEKEIKRMLENTKKRHKEGE